MNRSSPLRSRSSGKAAPSGGAAPTGKGTSTGRTDDHPEPDFDIDELRQLGQQELLHLTAKEEAEEPTTLHGLSRRELVARILFARSRRGSLGWERGILQVKPEGFGFLRSVHHHYRSGPDDIYISPNQIMRLRSRRSLSWAGIE